MGVILGTNHSVVLEGEIETLAGKVGVSASRKPPYDGSVGSVDIVNSANVSSGDEVVAGPYTPVDRVDVTILVSDSQLAPRPSILTKSPKPSARRVRLLTRLTTWGLRMS